MLEVFVLGGFGARVGGVDADLGGPRQRAVLALLLVARGHVVSADRIVEDLWRGEPPPRALAGLQAYVSNLRRALEPDRGPRAPARVLVSVPPGYAVRLDPDAVDAWRFERLLKDAAAAADPAAVADLLSAALDLWRGEAFAEVAHEPWAVPEVARLAELRLVARERLADALLRSGSTAEAAVEAEALATEHSTREEAWRLLALAHYAAGRQADALAALRSARAVLADELGLDPGRALVDLEAAVLAHTVQLPRIDVEERVPRARVQPAPDLPPGPPLVGRDAEVATVLTAVAGATPDRPALALVTGEPGSGKSALLDRIRHDLTARGTTVVVGRCPESEGAPPAWAWVEALRALAAVSDTGRWPAELAPLLDHRPSAPADSGGGGLGDRFRLHRAVTQWLAGTTGPPLVVVIDDLHAADGETLALLRSLYDLWPGGAPLAVVAALRPDEGGRAVEDALAALARHSPVRVRLRGLSAQDAGRLVADVTGQVIAPDVVAALADRTGGNPFYLRESARLLASEGALVATSEVPEGVRDVLRRRFSRLPETTVAILRTASVLGRDLDVDVLLAAAEADEGTVLDALDAGVVAGLLVEPEPGGLRFAHVLVRDTLYQAVSPLRRTRWHGRVAAALEDLRPDDLAALALHHRLSASARTAARAVDVNVAAAEQSRGRFGYDTEAEHLGYALDLLARVPAAAGRGGADERVDLLARRTRALLLAGATVTALEVRAEAVRTALAAGRDDLVVGFVRTVWVPTPWLTRPYGTRDVALVDELERLLAAGRLAAADRCRVLCLLATETQGDGDGVADAASEEALDLARRLGDPDLLLRALAALIEVRPADLFPGPHARIAAELAALADAQRATPYQVLGRHHQVRDAFAANDPALVGRLLDELTELVGRHQLGQAATALLIDRAAVAAASGRFETAVGLYAEGHREMSRHGAVDADGIAMLGRFCVAVCAGTGTSAFVAAARSAAQAAGGIAVDVLATALLDAGLPDEARRARARAAPVRQDFFWLLATTLRASAAARLGEVAECRVLRDSLAPYADLVAGAGTASFLIGPVGEVLAQCCVAVGEPAVASAYLDAAERTATAWGNGTWLARVAAARARVTG